MKEIFAPYFADLKKSRLLLAGIALFFLFFLSLLFKDLGVRPFHNDEGVNAWFTMNLVRDNNYKYDPTNYHGPNLYYFQLVATWINTLRIDGFKDFQWHSIDGMTDTSLRSVVLLAGILLLLGLLLTANRIGTIGGFSAFVMMGFSCDFLYFSRYFIHEIYLVLFSLGIYIGINYLADTKKAVWFYLIIICASMAFCTKETSIITFFILGFSYYCVSLTQKIFSAKSNRSSEPFIRRLDNLFVSLQIHFPLALFIGVLIWMFLFTSFLSNWAGPIDSIRAFKFWGGQGIQSGHVKPFFYFIQKILIPYELGIVILSFIGFIFSWIKKDDTGLYLSFWSMGAVGAYSLIPYKTPWCVINMLLPMALLGGYGSQQVFIWIDSQEKILNKTQFKTLWLCIVLFFSAFQIKQTKTVLYKEYDLDRRPQAYVHTSRDLLNLVSRIEEISKISEMGKAIRINLVSRESWPLPYYLRKYTSALYWGQYQNVPELDAPLLIADADQKPELEKLLRESYVIEEYSLRPVYQLNLYINKQLLPSDKDTSSILPKVFLASSISEKLEQGLTKKVFIGRRFKGDPYAIEQGKPDLYFNWSQDSEKIYPSPFSIEWSGYIKIPITGDYQFSITSDDGSMLYIDDRLVIDNGGSHASQSKEQRLTLEQGFHKIRAEYFDIGGEASFKLMWGTPGGQTEIIPSDALYTPKIDTFK